MGITPCITHILPCFLKCKITLKDVLKRINSLEKMLANAFIFNHPAFVSQTITNDHLLFPLLFSLVF